MTKEEFQVELRREIKIAKRQFLKNDQYPKVYRQWNLYKVQLKGLRAVMQNFPELEAKDVEKLIKQNPTSLKFLNDCLMVMPNMIEDLCANDYSYIFEKFYEVKRRELDRIKEERRNLRTK